MQQRNLLIAIILILCIGALILNTATANLSASYNPDYNDYKVNSDLKFTIDSNDSLFDGEESEEHTF
jgi:hypothetical protein